MFRAFRGSAVIALSCVMATAALTACDETSETSGSPSNPATTGKAENALVSGTQKIKIEGRSVNVSCTGPSNAEGPVIVLMAGLGDPLDKLAGIQKTLGRQNRVCSYDRLGEGASDKPAGPQTFADSGKILTGVLARTAGDRPVVLAGHSLGGAIAARYAPDHKDKVKGLVLMDATSPTAVADTTALIPESATGPAAQVRGQIVATSQGQNPEQLAVTDGEVRSAGDIPVEVIQHGKPYLAGIPEYGPGLEKLWSQGQRKWLAVSGDSRLSTAAESGHHIYLDQPEVAVQAVQRVTAQAAGQ